MVTGDRNQKCQERANKCKRQVWKNMWEITKCAKSDAKVKWEKLSVKESVRQVHGFRTWSCNDIYLLWFLLVAMDGRSKRTRTQLKRHARIPRHPARTAHKARGHTNRKAETTTAGTRATTKKEAATEPDLGTPQVSPREQPLPAEAHQINSFQPRPPPAARSEQK